MELLFEPLEADRVLTEDVLDKVSNYPRLRYMGSKYKILPHLVRAFSKIPCDTALDAFSGSGVVAYALKTMGKRVAANDFLNFSATVAKAVVENPGVQLDQDDINLLLSPSKDGRDFIQRTFQGLYFPDEDHAFLDSAWSHIDDLPEYKREIAIASLCLAAARKQPRGVFTVTTFRYDDGRRQLRMSLRDLFLEAVNEYNAIVFDNGHVNTALCQDVFDVDPSDYELVYLDPPYAPPKDDNCYIKRYHFLEGLSVYWRGQTILEETVTKKLEKRYTPFSYKHTIRDALRELVFKFRRATIILSYSSNSVPDKDELLDILRKEKKEVDVLELSHRYSFGTHNRARRTKAQEYIFVCR